VRVEIRAALGVALGLAVLVVGSPAGSQPRADEASPATFAALMARFATVPGLTASFREEKRIALLAAPLVSEGTIAFAPPGRLSRRTLRPEPSTVVVDGMRLRVRDRTSQQELDLRGHTALGTLVASFVRLLAGDRVALERSFTVQYQVGAAGWSVVLRPREAAIRGFVRQIRAEGRGAVLARLVVVDGHGDESDTTFTHVDAAHRFDASALRRIFGLSR